LVCKYIKNRLEIKIILIFSTTELMKNITA